MMLKSDFAPIFLRDVKRLKKKHVDTEPLRDVIKLILQNTPETREELVRRHNMHSLSGEWANSQECHVCNAGDWLLVWTIAGEIAYFQRTGTHNEIFR